MSHFVLLRSRWPVPCRDLRGLTTLAVRQFYGRDQSAKSKNRIQPQAGAKAADLMRHPEVGVEERRGPRAFPSFHLIQSETSSSRGLVWSST